jgi:hypothetical protein
VAIFLNVLRWMRWAEKNIFSWQDGRERGSERGEEKEKEKETGEGKEERKRDERKETYLL